jgi:hypothetical protein
MMIHGKPLSIENQKYNLTLQYHLAENKKALRLIKLHALANALHQSEIQ